MKSHSPGMAPRAALVGLRRWTAACVLALMTVTYPLWLAHRTPSFPQIPLLEIFCEAPYWVDGGLLLTTIIGLVAYIAFGARYTFAASLVILVSGLGLTLLNQHRLQPWFYQLLLFAVVYLGAEKKNDSETNSRLRLLQILVVSIYFYSALGKFDFEFFHTVGQTFVRAALGSLGLDIGDWSAPARLSAVAVLPIAEMLLAASLLMGVIRQDRKLLKFGGIAAFVFHLALMALLGLALHHSLGVVVWNLQFAGQALLLFVLPTTQPKTVDSPRFHIARNLSTLAVGIAIVMPIVERFGYWDHWPSWALYAPHSSRVEVFVAAPATEKLPAELQKLLTIDQDALWVRVPLSTWSLAETGTPVYPQARFELGVAREIATILDSEFAIRVSLLSVSNRLNGRRAAVELQGATEIHKAKNRFLLNTRPREGHD